MNLHFAKKITKKQSPQLRLRQQIRFLDSASAKKSVVRPRTPQLRFLPTSGTEVFQVAFFYASYEARGPYAAQTKVLCGPVSFSLMATYNTMTTCLYFDNLELDIFAAWSSVPV